MNNLLLKYDNIHNEDRHIPIYINYFTILPLHHIFPQVVNCPNLFDFNIVKKEYYFMGWDM